MVIEESAVGHIARFLLGEHAEASLSDYTQIIAQNGRAHHLLPKMIVSAIVYSTQHLLTESSTRGLDHMAVVYCPSAQHLIVAAGMRLPRSSTLPPRLVRAGSFQSGHMASAHATQPTAWARYGLIIPLPCSGML